MLDELHDIYGIITENPKLLNSEWFHNGLRPKLFPSKELLFFQGWLIGGGDWLLCNLRFLFAEQFAYAYKCVKSVPRN
jgi:hypothetical protein